MNLLDTRVQTAYYFTERENRRSPVVRGWLGGAMVLGKYSEPKRPTVVGQGSIALAVGAGCLDIFFSRLSFLFSFSLFGRRPDRD